MVSFPSLMRKLFQWDLGTRQLELGRRTLLMGIVVLQSNDRAVSATEYLRAWLRIKHPLRPAGAP